MKTPFLFDFEKIVLDGGKHKGETIGFVAATDPRYLVWAWFSEASALVMAVPAWYVHAVRQRCGYELRCVTTKDPAVISPEELQRTCRSLYNDADEYEDIDYGEHDDAGDRD